MTIDETGIGFSSGFSLSLQGSSSSEFQYRNLPTAQTGTAAVFYSTGGRYDLVPQSSTRRHKKNITRRDQLADIELIPSRYKRKGHNNWEYGLIVEDLVDQDPVLGIWDQNVDRYDDYNTRGVIAVMAAKLNRLEKAVL